MNDSQRLQLRNNVHAGSILLDQVEPDWFRRVSLDTLAMESCNQCILGQIYGDYTDGFNEIAGESRDQGFQFQSSTFGFTLSSKLQDMKPKECEIYIDQKIMPDRIQKLFSVLGDFWRDEICQRLSSQDGQ